jgi:hypothetical protein
VRRRPTERQTTPRWWRITAIWTTCCRVQAFAASNAQQTPAGTDRWLAKLAVLQTAQQSRLAAFQAVLERFRSPADAGLVADSEKIQRRFGAAVKSILMPEAKRLLSALGLSS